MSPSDEVTTIERSHNLEVSTGGQIGKDSDELQGVATSRGIGTSRKRRTETGRCGNDDGDELSAEQGLAKRYREGGTEGLKHGSAGRESNLSSPFRFCNLVILQKEESAKRPTQA